MIKNIYCERDVKIFSLYQSGVAIKQLSKEFRLSDARIRQIIKHQKTRNNTQYNENDIHSLNISNKTKLALLRSGINDIDMLVNQNKETLLSIRGLGKQCYLEIEDALHAIGKDFIVDKF